MKDYSDYINYSRKIYDVYMSYGDVTSAYSNISRNYKIYFCVERKYHAQ